MKKAKKLSLFLATVLMINILSLATALPVSAATESATYIIADFEDGSVGNTDGNEFSFVDGPGVSENALQVTDGSVLPEFDFGLRSQPSYDEDADGEDDVVWKYNMSAWIRADEAVTSDTVDLIFTLDNPAYDSKSFYETIPETVTETVSISTAGLTQGQWVKVTKTFTYDGTTTGSYKSWTSNTTKDYTTSPVGTVKLKVSGGIAYTMDDLVIMPDKYTPMQTKTQNPIFPTKLDDISTISSSTSPWKVADAQAGELNTSYNGTSVTAFGETETIGNAVTITNTDYYSALIYSNTSLKFGTEYTIEFMAKAENADAVNLKPTVILTFYSSEDKNLGTWSQHPAREGSPAYADVSEVTLADGWKKFRANVFINKTTTSEAKASVCIRMYGDTATTAVWSVANVDMYQTKDEFTNLSSVSHFTGNKLSDGTVHANLSTSLMTGQYSAYESRLELPYGDDYVIYKRYKNADNKDEFIYQGAEIENARLVTNVTDSDNYFSNTFITPIDMKSTGLTAAAEIDQTVWAADMPNLTATVRYNDAAGSETLLALCAMYDENGKMVSYDVKDVEITAGEGEQKLSMATTEDAASACVFLWESETTAPRLDKSAQITKTTGGGFIYVDYQNGTSNTTYGYENPVKTVNQAVSAAGQLSAAGEDIYIILMPGRHPVTSEIAITEAMTDAGHNLTFVSYDKNDRGEISGASDISGKFSYYEKGIYRAPVTRGTQSRQLYVNGVKATKARTRDLDQTEFTNTSTRNANNVHLLGTLGAITTSSEEWQYLADVTRPSDLEFVFFVLWTKNSCQVESITDDGSGTITFNMDSPGWHSLNSQYNCYARSPLYIENAYEFLDEPGEWYLDSTAGYVYYMPREYDDMTTAEVMLPVLDNDMQYLMSIEGSDSESVQNLTFDNVVFTHTTWNRPNTAVGHSASQNNLLSDYYEYAGATKYSSERLRTIESAIDIQNANNITFTGCEFSKLGGNGIRVFWNVQNCDITGCEFYDISSSAIHVGDANTEDDTKVGQLTYGANIENVTISDNYIHHVADDFWSAAAIGVTWAKNTLIEHNEIAHIPYSGMHIGLGWEGSPTAEPTDLTIDVKNNYIHDAFCYGYIYDGAPIYTNGLTGGSADNLNEISGNYIEGVGPGAASIYNDEGSTYYYVHDNVMDVRDSWTETNRITGNVMNMAQTQNINITKNERDHGLVWKNNYVATRRATVQEKAYIDESNDIDNCIQIGQSGEWCDEAKEIITNSGIRDEYMDNFRYGLREVSAIAEADLEIGESIPAIPSLLTVKGEGYKSNSTILLSTTSSDTAVAEIIDDRVVAVGGGTSIITYEAIENGISYTAQTIVTVPLEADYIADLTAYRMSFENGGSVCITIPNTGYPIVRESEAITNTNETVQIVDNPKGSGKVMKVDLLDTVRGDSSSLALASTTDTSSIWAGSAKAAGTIPAGGTITYTFRYYWAQDMSAENNPAFCIYHGTGGVFASGTDFKTEPGKWHTAVLTYTNTSTEPKEVGGASIRLCGANAPARTWKVVGSNGYSNDTSTTPHNFGGRTVYIDNITVTIE